jgi:hypothetical protein
MLFGQAAGFCPHQKRAGLADVGASVWCDPAFPPRVRSHREFRRNVKADAPCQVLAPIFKIQVRFLHSRLRHACWSGRKESRHRANRKQAVCHGGRGGGKNAKHAGCVGTREFLNKAELAAIE